MLATLYKIKNRVSCWTQQSLLSCFEVSLKLFWWLVISYWLASAPCFGKCLHDLWKCATIYTFFAYIIIHKTVHLWRWERLAWTYSILPTAMVPNLFDMWLLATSRHMLNTSPSCIQLNQTMTFKEIYKKKNLVVVLLSYPVNHLTTSLGVLPPPRLKTTDLE